MARAAVLVVDDEAANLHVVSQILNDAGYAVTTALDSDRALQFALQHPPDLILLDALMPETDGFETYRRIKAEANMSDVPILFLVTLSDAESRARALDMGAADYVTKPFHPRELLTRVNMHLHLQQYSKELDVLVSERTRELASVLTRLKQSQLKLVRSEKMSTLGTMVAGVAHEINNPVGFLGGSIDIIKTYTQALLDHLAHYQQHYPDAAIAIKNHAAEIELDFLTEDLPKALNSMAGAIERIRNISTSLRTFSRSDRGQKVMTDIHEGINGTLLILKYRLKADEHRPVIQIEKNYGELPLVKCSPSQLNQVFMNILANAIDVFDEAAQSSSFQELEAHPQTIMIQTAVKPGGEMVEIRIRDNGKGMTDEVQAQIFDYLFTTKEVSKGTGLGLAIAHQIVAEKHGGYLEVQSEPAQGTEFCICLPIQ